MGTVTPRDARSVIDEVEARTQAAWPVAAAVILAKSLSRRHQLAAAENLLCRAIAHHGADLALTQALIATRLAMVPSPYSRS